MIFSSDNWAGAAPEIVAAIAGEAATHGPAYGASDVDRRVAERFDAMFEREVTVLLVATGTAANALSLAAANRPGGAVFCHDRSHVIEDECGAVEYLTGGGRLVGVPGEGGKLVPEDLDRAMAHFGRRDVHSGQPMAVSITQLTEAGTAYTPDEIAALARIAGQGGVPLHMDGARFANAVAALGVSPADLSWRAGVDMMSFGATKNGCVCAEAIVFFRPDLAAQAGFLRKRAGQLFSKSRFLAAQFDAYLADGLWLELAGHANGMADQLRAGIASCPAAALAWETRGNEIFADIDAAACARLRARGATFYDWPAPILEAGRTRVRLVTSFATRREEVDGFVELLGE